MWDKDKKEKKSIAVLGLGKYGSSLAENLYKLGADVLVVDQNEDLVDDFSDKSTSAICANLNNEDEVLALGLKDMDVVVTAMGGSMSASIMSVAVAKEQGVPLVISKTSSERMTSILKKVGADRVLDPDGEGGSRYARILMSKVFKDFFEIDSNMYMVEMEPQKDWIGKNLVELDLRKKYNLNVVAIKESGSRWHFVDPMKPFVKDSVLLIVMEKKSINKL
jgi:trk system potassium uptake protein TrkA